MVVSVVVWAARVTGKCSRLLPREHLEQHALPSPLLRLSASPRAGAASPRSECDCSDHPLLSSPLHSTPLTLTAHYPPLTAHITGALPHRGSSPRMI
eukprot:3941564-Rhodomonas_salina.2